MSDKEQTFHVGDAGSNPAGDASTYERSAAEVSPVSDQSPSLAAFHACCERLNTLPSDDQRRLVLRSLRVSFKKLLASPIEDALAVAMRVKTRGLDDGLTADDIKIAFEIFDAEVKRLSKEESRLRDELARERGRHDHTESARAWAQEKREKAETEAMKLIGDNEHLRGQVDDLSQQLHSAIERGAVDDAAREQLEAQLASVEALIDSRAHESLIEVGDIRHALRDPKPERDPNLPFNGY